MTFQSTVILERRIHSSHAEAAWTPASTSQPAAVRFMQGFPAPLSVGAAAEAMTNMIFNGLRCHSAGLSDACHE